MADVSFSFRRKRNTEILQIFVATSAPSQPPAMTTASRRGRRNCQQDSEAAINRQIRLQLCASPVHLSVSYYFARDDGALKNCAKYFSLFTRLLRRGNRLRNAGSCRTSEAAESCFRKKPDRDDRENGLDAMERALRLERRVRQPLLELHRLAPGKSGPHPCDLAETHYPSEQVGAIRERGDPITSLRQLGAPASGGAEHLLDKHRLGYSEGQASGWRPAAEG